MDKSLKQGILKEITNKEITFKNLKHFIDEACYRLYEEQILKQCKKSFIKTYQKARNFAMCISKKSLKAYNKTYKKLFKSGYHKYREYSLRHIHPGFSFNSTILFYGHYLSLKKAKKDIVTVLDTKNRVHWIIELYSR
jgi:hypothetical protein